MTFLTHFRFPGFSTGLLNDSFHKGKGGLRGVRVQASR